MNQDELEAVQSLFCLPGECVFRDGLSSSDSSRPDSVKIIFHLGKDYPLQFPQISVFSENLDRDAVSRVKSKVLQTCSDLLGEPMLISLISAVRENVQLELESKHSSTVPVNNSQSVSNDKIWSTILHIDHMRSKNKYCKSLEKWASDLNLCGKILFCNKLILVLLQGEVENIKDFVVRLKTVSIDVDSKGHSCKERMMTVLCEKQSSVTDITRYNSLTVWLGKRESVSKDEEMALKRVQEELLYVCGSVLFPGGVHQDSVLVKEGLSCSSPIEVTYYAGKTVTFDSICYHCGDTELEENNNILNLKEQFGIVRPICRTCIDNGKTIVTRNALEDFERKEVANREELEKIFFELGLVALYKEHVCRLH